jgi:hypothetical protein
MSGSGVQIAMIRPTITRARFLIREDQLLPQINGAYYVEVDGITATSDTTVAPVAVKAILASRSVTKVFVLLALRSNLRLAFFSHGSFDRA